MDVTSYKETGIIFGKPGIELDQLRRTCFKRGAG